ncbi:MAG TPA: hypothetical protein VHO48_08030 [Anaerolineaceae bacterium]|nr:hypothetical protein [Anaerolineaceae bacterium]
MIHDLLPAETFREMMDASRCLGIAPSQARVIAGEIEQTIL